jgi:hypothetical protein
LLNSIDQRAFDHHIAQLLNPHAPADSVELVGWSWFSELAGDDLAARALYARIAQRQYLRHGPGWSPRGISDRNDPIDRQGIDPADAAAWALAIANDASGGCPVGAGTPERFAVLLASSVTGPSPRNRTDRIVLSRLIVQWIERHAGCVSMRQRLLIAMRHRCGESAARLSEQALSDPAVSASGVVTALLCASALDRPHVDGHLQSRLDDARTAHVWQLFPSSKTKIRTQVRDVALALWLHRRGIDPRSVGFVEVQADPDLVYREHSLGFADDTTRDAALQKAAAMTGLSAARSGDHPPDRLGSHRSR